MTTFEVPEMTCGHCVKAITQAVKGVDPVAAVDVDLSTKIVAVESNATVESLAAAIHDAGYDLKRA